MSKVIKASVEGIEQQANEMEREIKNIEDKLKAIDAIITGTKNYWIGEASDKHQKDYKKSKGTSDKLLKELKVYPEKLLKVAGVYRDTTTKAVERTATLTDEVFHQI